MRPSLLWVALISTCAWAQAPSTADSLCPTPYVNVAGMGCAALPREPDGTVLLYFHGLVASPWSRTVAAELRALSSVATPAGVTVLALRGEQGLCTWSEAVSRAWCWPNGLVQLAEAEAVLERVKLAMADAARLAARTLKAPVVVGFSNGGFFTAMLATNSPLEARAFVVAQGGAVNGQTFLPERRKPMLLIGAKADRIQLPRMKELANALKAAQWDARFVIRAGHHELIADDARIIVSFARRLPP